MPGTQQTRRLCAVIWAVASLPLSLLSGAPTALAYEGYGYQTIGGQGGSTCHVTTLASSGSGSLLDCVVNRSGPRIVVFDVAGTIVPSNVLRVKIPYITIDGTTAPSPGITVRPRDSSTNLFVIEDTHDVIIRGLRLVGYNPTGTVEGGADLVGFDGRDGNEIYNVVIDHLSLSAADDGALDITGNVHDITVSWCFLYSNRKTNLIKYDTRQRISIHHNVYAHNAERNPQVKGDMRTFDFRNNIVYDWHLLSWGYGTWLWSAPSGADSPGVPSVNIIGNAFIAKNTSDGCGIEVIEDSSPVQRWVADNIFSPSPCIASNLAAELAIPVGARVTTSPSSQLAAVVLPTVGLTPHNSTEQALLDEIAARLPASSTLTIDDVQVAEGNGGTTDAVFTVRLSPASGQVVSVNYATANGTAVAPADYTMITGSLSFLAGTTTRTVAVPVVSDLLDEANETFLVRLSNASGAIVGDAQATGTVVDDDPPPVLAIDDVSVPEGEAGTTVAAFTLSLSAPSGRVVSVAAATAQGTAIAGLDYLEGARTVVFPAGDSVETLNVAVRGDRVWEADETFLVGLSAPVNATLADTQGTGTILNDDPQGLSIAAVDVVEPVAGTRSAVFAVTLSPPSASVVTVGYATSALTATAGSDYDDTSGSLIFDPGVSTQPISVTIRADGLTESPETFHVNLSGPTGAAIAYGQAAGRIHDPGNLFTLTPCRVFDTRDGAGPYGGPPLAAGQSRVFTLAGRCGIPVSARAVSLNLTVTQATAQGNLRLYPADQAVPLTSTLNYVAGQTRANNAIVGLSPSGALAVRCAQAFGTAHAILDVTGYFE